MSKREADHNLGYAINDVTRLLRRAFDTSARKYGLTRAQWRILAHLFRSDGQTQREIASQLDMEAAPVGRMLDKLEENGWISRRADEKDRRVRRVFMTKKINPHIEELRRDGDELSKAALAGCGKQQVQIFVEVLELMRANLVRHISNYDNAPSQ